MKDEDGKAIRRRRAWIKPLFEPAGRNRSRGGKEMAPSSCEELIDIDAARGCGSKEEETRRKRKKRRKRMKRRKRRRRRWRY